MFLLIIRQGDPLDVDMSDEEENDEEGVDTQDEEEAFYPDHSQWVGEKEENEEEQKVAKSTPTAPITEKVTAFISIF